MDNRLKEWLSKSNHLPDGIRDFHDQKDLFGMLNDKNLSRIAYYKEKHGFNPPEAVVNCMAGHIYVIDIFLWFMASCGYTLQKTRLPIERRPQFKDLGEEIKKYRMEKADVRLTELKRMKRDDQADLL